MAPIRPSTPPPRKASSMEFGIPSLQPPSTPGPRIANLDGNIIMGSQHAVVPPSPGAPPPSGSPTMSTPQDAAVPLRNLTRKHDARTGAGVKKIQPKRRADGTVAKLIDAAFREKTATSDKALQKPFRFMDLPGEIRNMVYQHTYGHPKQALLVHRPRIASLRSRTRHDRSRPLASDVIGKEHDEKLSTIAHRSNRPKPKVDPMTRATNRPFFGLTQVCQQIRHEYRPIYLQKQEIGMDLTQIVEYLQTFYSDAPSRIANLPAPGARESDMPFTGNLTIAVGDKATALERAAEGVEVFPLLDIWANSFKIEAGFGRYLKVHYVPENDGEAKDLYRLFGRRVLRNRSCSAMNGLWRTILRTRSLASVRIHRKPAPIMIGVGGLVGSVPPTPTPGTGVFPVGPLGSVSQEVKPYLHIIFKKESAEPWMTKFESDIRKAPLNWLADRGFGGMEYFDVRVGVAPAGTN